MDRITRKGLKTDKFQVEVEHGIEYVAGHRKQLGVYAGAAAAVILIASGTWYYRNYQHGLRQQELSKAIEVAEAPIGPADQVPAGLLSFRSQDEKNAELVKKFTVIFHQFPGTDEGSVAASYLGAIAADKGDLKEAEKYFQTMVDKGNANYGSIGKRSLAFVYLSTGKKAEAEALLRSLLEKPTGFVSKEQATLDLARVLASSKPAEARKLLEPLRTDKSAAVSQSAITALAELPHP